MARYITVAAKEGGGDPNMNSALANAIEKAKEYNMPADNIERAVKKGTGELAGVSYEHITYEGYGPGGVAILVDIMTDNRNRTAADMRHIFTKHGGNLGTSGSVAWIFVKKGIVLVSKSENIDEEGLLNIVLDAGAEDLKAEDDHFEVVCEPGDLSNIKAALESEKIAYQSADISMLPKEVIKPDASDARKLLKLMDLLEEHDDVQQVYANFDISDELIEELA